jgi:hypothetical protein
MSIVENLSAIIAVSLFGLLIAVALLITFFTWLLTRS